MEPAAFAACPSTSTGRASALYATAFARHLLRSGYAQPGDLILVGRDFRDSSPSISATCIGALKRAGLTPVDCGTVPTPALALYGLELKAASLMITGSHIPADRNGIKFYRPDGEIDKQDELAISAEAAAIGDASLDETPGIGEDRTAETEALFFERNIALLPADSLAGLTVGVYQHSTVARDLLRPGAGPLRRARRAARPLRKLHTRRYRSGLCGNHPPAEELGAGAWAGCDRFRRRRRRPAACLR